MKNEAEQMSEYILGDMTFLLRDEDGYKQINDRLRGFLISCPIDGAVTIETTEIVRDRDNKIVADGNGVVVYTRVNYIAELVIMTPEKIEIVVRQMKK